MNAVVGSTAVLLGCVRDEGVPTCPTSPLSSIPQLYSTLPPLGAFLHCPFKRSPTSSIRNNLWGSRVAGSVFTSRHVRYAFDRATSISARVSFLSHRLYKWPSAVENRSRIWSRRSTFCTFVLNWAAHSGARYNCFSLPAIRATQVIFEESTLDTRLTTFPPHHDAASMLWSCETA